MMRTAATLLGLVMLATLVAAPQAEAQTNIQAMALAVQPIKPADLGYTLIWAGPASGIRGNTRTVAPYTITIYVRESDTASSLARLLAHEIGHAIDITRNDIVDRHNWQLARGIKRAPWWPGNGAPDLATGAGDFAECYAAWAVNAQTASTFGGCAGTGQLMATLVGVTPPRVALSAPLPVTPPVAPEPESIETWWARLFPNEEPTT